MKSVELYHFSGAGNNFVVLDGRTGDVSPYRTVPVIREECARLDTDGLMILSSAPEGYAFSMEFFNPDGSGGMMCGNGGRCIVAFADLLGIGPDPDGIYRFLAPDGPHQARILSRDGAGKWTVRLKMTDVAGVKPVKDGFFLNTGTRHFVRFVPDVDGMDVEKEGKALRWDDAFAPEGTNANFVEVGPDLLKIRTFEKGVEGETLACGTGITASAIAAFYSGRAAGNEVRLRCRRGDVLSVSFQPQGDGSYREVFLTGPAEIVQS